MGYFLKRLGIDFVIVDAAPEVGHAWRQRWDSLRLFSSARFSALPGLAFPGDPDRYPTKEEVADYLRDYADRFALPIRLSERVQHLGAAGATYELATRERTYQAPNVVIAVGGRHASITPRFAERLSDRVVQLHVSEYRRPSQFPSGTVVVVGSGDSGRQIADELVDEGRRVVLAPGKWRLRFPQRVLGHDVFYWLNKINALATPARSRRARWIRQHDPVVGPSLRALRRKGVRLATRAVEAHNGAVIFADGHQELVAGVLWATGFKVDFSWVDLPVVHDGAPAHDQGIAALPGIYFLGLPWQRTSGSALIGWVGEDASRIARRIAERADAGSSTNALHRTSTDTASRRIRRTIQ